MNEDHFLPEVVDPAPAPSCRRARGRAGAHHAHQAGDADDPLPHRRRHRGSTAEPCLRPDVGPHGPDQGAQRRHADHPGVNVYPSEVEAALLAVADLQPHYQLVVDRTATLARLEVQVEPAEATVAGAAAASTTGAEIRRRVSRLREVTGLGSAHLALTIPRSGQWRARPPPFPAAEGKAVRGVGDS